MITLTLIFCLHANALSCTTKDHALPPGTGLMACMIGAQQTASAFTGENPEYDLKTFRCTMENRRSRSA